IGMGKVDELRAAIADFRKSGKKVFAYIEEAEGKDYLVACACDEIYMPECGSLMLVGMRMEMSFYKDLFDKIGVKADMLQMGAFKGAGEPYTRTGMSPQLRKQMESILDDYFEKSFVDAIVRSRTSRQWTADKVKALIDGGPYTAKAAHKAGLIDSVGYSQQVPDLVKASLKADRVKITKDYSHAESEQIDFSSPLSILKMLAPSKPSISKGSTKIALIYATGPIITGKSTSTFFGGEVMGSTTMIEAIRQAEQDKAVKAIVLRVDSPGGSALASDLIWNELTRCKK